MVNHLQLNYGGECCNHFERQWNIKLEKIQRKYCFDSIRLLSSDILSGDIFNISDSPEICNTASKFFNDKRNNDRFFIKTPNMLIYSTGSRVCNAMFTESNYIYLNWSIFHPVLLEYNSTEQQYNSYRTWHTILVSDETRVQTALILIIKN